MKPIKLSSQQWKVLKDTLTIEYQNTPSVMLIRSKMRDTLGFTIREHQEWNVVTPNSENEVLSAHRRRQTWFMLDFYQESMRTMFLLKYSHIINDS